MYVPFQRAGSAAAPAIRGKFTAPANKTRGQSQKTHISATQTPQADRRSNSAIRRVRNANETRKPQASLHISTATHNIPPASTGYVYAGGFSWLRRLSHVMVLFW